MPALAGIRDLAARRSGEALSQMAASMAAAMRIRGPGEATRWSDPGAGVALACRGPGPAGSASAQRQVYLSADGRFVLACEGEIYNTGELTAALHAAGRLPQGYSDAAIMVEAAAAWGAAGMLKRLDGGAAGVLWDREQRTLYLFRDRFGKYSLYWTICGSEILFASELKALRACPQFHAELDRDVVAAYLRRRYIPAPSSIYRGARMLEPGTLLSIDAAGKQTRHSYYSLEDVVASAQAHRFQGSDDEAVSELDRLLREAVERRIGTGPVGVFLSGGIDSSMLLAQAQSLTPGRARSYAAGFRETGYDEADHASSVARHLGAEHETLHVSAGHALEFLPGLPAFYDEPLADASQIPTYFLARLAGIRVESAFTGDGAEPFGVYNRYLSLPALMRYVDRLPGPARQGLKAVIGATPALPWLRVPVELPVALQPVAFAQKIGLLARLIAGSDDDAYRMSVSYWHDPGSVVIGAREMDPSANDPRLKMLIPDKAERLEYAGMSSIMPGCVLPKVDRACAAAGLPARMPFLDERLVAFGWSLPRAMKLRGDINKWLLRQLLHRYVPPALVDRPKAGFDVPIGAWLRGPLRDWAEALLTEKRLRDEGVFHAGPIRRRWHEHLEGRRNWQSPLWVVLMFQVWKERWLP